MIGVPIFDDYLTKIEESTEEAEVRNLARDLAKDHGLKQGQITSLMDIVALKITALTGQLRIETDKPGGGDAPESKGSPSANLHPNIRSGSVSTPPGSKMPMPIVSPEEAAAAFKSYRAITNAVIDSTDIVNIKGKPFVKKSGWRKVARCFGISVDIVFEETTPAGFKVWAKATAPNGASWTGVAMATHKEKPDATDHQLYALAATRATNRAISDLAGVGEPSAEEVE